MQSENIDELVKALVIVQGALKPAKFNQENPFFKSRYADLGSIWDSCRSLLKDNGLAVIQTMGLSNNGPVIITTLAHESGQYFRGELRLNPEKNTPQAIGSAITYGRRYSLGAILGIVTDEDDDGNSSSEAEKPASTSKKGPKLTKKQISFIKRCQASKKALGEEVYYQVLGMFGYQKSNEVEEGQMEALGEELSLALKNKANEGGE